MRDHNVEVRAYITLATQYSLISDSYLIVIHISGYVIVVYYHAGKRG